MIWISADIAKSSGVAVWDGPELLYLFRVWPTDDNHAWKVRKWQPEGGKMVVLKDVRCATQAEAWERVWLATFGQYTDFVAEALYGPMAAGLAERRGMIRAWLGATDVALSQVRPQTWRGAAVFGSETVWPDGREAKKKFSVYLAEEVLGVKLPNDVSDAFFIGKWFLVRERYANRDRTKKRVRQAPKSRSGGGLLPVGRRVLQDEGLPALVSDLLGEADDDGGLGRQVSRRAAAVARTALPDGRPRAARKRSSEKATR